jgi:PDZ domain-containing secreted protein
MTDVRDTSSAAEPDSLAQSNDGPRNASPWSLRRFVPPRGSRPVIASVPVFAQSDRRQIWRIAKWGEVIESHPGEVLVREDYTDYWFFVLLSGSAQVTRKGRTVATLHRGDHFGEIAIVGFRPQPTTVTAVEPSVLFVLGRRHLLTLSVTDTTIQRSLFPQAGGNEYRDFVRALRAEGRRDWERLRPRYSSGHSYGRATAPGRELSWREAVDVLSHQTPGTHAEPAAPVLPPRKRRSPLLPIAIAAAFVALIATVYHPPVAVISPGRTIDIVQDISITGARVYQPTGHYLLTPVNVGRPRLAGLIAARVLGHVVVRTKAPDEVPLDPNLAARQAHAVFINSHRQAIALAEKTLGVRTSGITIAIRDRGIVGPSAGLVYALAIVDMLGAGDLAAHRVIAATGELLPNGNVGPVGFVSLKAEAAHIGGAVTFLVPQKQVLDTHTADLAVVGVPNLKEAIRVLQRRR